MPLPVVSYVTLGLAILLSGCTLIATDAVPDQRAEQPATTSEAAAVSEAEQAVPEQTSLTYQAHPLAHSVVHTVTIPADSGWQIDVAVAASLTPLSELATTQGAIAAINAGFFDPRNGLTTSFVTVNGDLVADPRQNAGLMENPDLQSYLQAILDRSEFRVYDCGGAVQYDITAHAAAVPSTCQMTAAVGAGPQLLPTQTGYAEGFLADNKAGDVVRDALGSQSPNARSAIGLKADGTVVLAIASQRPGADQATGLTLPEMAEFLQTLGVERALNLDGGSSSGLYFEGETYWGRVDASGAAIERPIKSILWVR
ncbi:MAG: phosphodiester glycosidase family protein [Leptolyngbyaceae cyanobacterium]